MVAAPVEDVPRGLHDHALEPVGRDRRDGRDDQPADDAHVPGVDEAADERHRHEHHERRGDQQGELVLVDLKDALENPSDVELLIHAPESIAVPDSLRGHLLIAAPSLFDYFRRTVVLVLEHTPEGAMGVVLGRETETLRGGRGSRAGRARGRRTTSCTSGGPVAPESVVALGDFGQPDEAGNRVVGSLGTLDPDGANDSLRRLRVFAGYAGLGAPGSSTPSSSEDAGSCSPPTRRTRSAPGDIWSEALGRKGGRYRLHGDHAGGPVAQLSDQPQRRTSRAVARARAA